MDYRLYASYSHKITAKLSLTLSWRRPLSYRNQFTDLGSKSMDWFLYDNGLRHERFKNNCTFIYLLDLFDLLTANLFKWTELNWSKKIFSVV